MTNKERLLQQLKLIGDFHQKLLADFKTPEQWTHQVYPGTNHALWYAGHTANTHNFAISQFAPEKKRDEPVMAAKFGAGSQPTNNPADYPPADEVLAYARDRRQTLVAAIEALSDADLDKPLVNPRIAFLTDFSSLVNFIVFHEWMHAGQVTVVRRALGFKPLVEMPPRKN